MHILEEYKSSTVLILHLEINSSAQNKGRDYVYTDGLGRFGNLVFEYASTMGIANHTKKHALFGRQMSYLQYVFPKVKIITLKNPPQSWRRIQDNKTWDFDQNLFELSKGNVIIEGHLSSFRYFENISSWLYDDVLSYMNKALLVTALRFIKQVKDDYAMKHSGINPSTVCVHVRRGDKATERAKYWGYRLPEPSDIIHAMNYMRQKLNHSVFVVSSESKQWCFENLPEENVHISNMTSYEEDFVLMSCCDHMIMTVGTFGWWASWLTSRRGGTSMYFNHPFMTGSELNRELDRKDVFPSNWKAYNSTDITETCK